MEDNRGSATSPASGRSMAHASPLAPIVRRNDSPTSSPGSLGCILSPMLRGEKNSRARTTAEEEEEEEGGDENLFDLAAPSKRKAKNNNKKKKKKQVKEQVGKKTAKSKAKNKTNATKASTKSKAGKARSSSSRDEGAEGEESGDAKNDIEKRQIKELTEKLGAGTELQEQQLQTVLDKLGQVKAAWKQKQDAISSFREGCAEQRVDTSTLIGSKVRTCHFYSVKPFSFHCAESTKLTYYVFYRAGIPT
jgi:hypothetical protein